jgi:predicted RNA-binding Zn ribbon-like protein
MSGYKEDARFVGDHLILDFVDSLTTDQNGTLEAMPTYAAAVRWFEAAGVLAAADARGMLRFDGTPEADATLASLRAFRSVLRAMLDEHRTSGVIGQRYVDAINEQLSRCGCARALVRRSGAYVVEVGYGFTRPDDLLMLLANAAADLIAGEDLTRIKRCGSDCCDMYFLDTSRNRSRTWCDMAVCGNRAKSAAHYRRSRERAAAPPA